MNSMADEEDGTVQVKSRYGSDLRRFTVRRNLDDYQSFLRLVLDAHHLPSRADVALFFHHPSSPSDVLPIKDGPSLSRALLTVTSPPLRVEVHLRSGLWERESSGEEEDLNSSGSESSLSDSPPHSPAPPSPRPSPPPSSSPPSSPPHPSSSGKECVGDTARLGDWTPPSLPPHPILSMLAKAKEEGLYKAAHSSISAALPTQLQSLSLHDSNSQSPLVNSVHDDQEEDRFPYVIEIYNFDPSLTTRDIIREMHKKYSQKEFRLKWVDDTHALGIFGNSKQAWLSANAPYQQFKTRLLRDGTEQSQSIASKLAEELRPRGSAPRPKTTAVVARRLVASALGVRLSREQRERERVQRKELQVARDQKRSGDMNVVQ